MSEALFNNNKWNFLVTNRLYHTTFQILTMLNYTDASRQLILDNGLVIIDKAGKTVDEDAVTFDRTWKSHFGVSLEVASKTWDLMIAEELIPKGATVKNLLWTLHWLKCYPTESVVSCKVGVDVKTWRKVTTEFLLPLSKLEQRVVRIRTCFCLYLLTLYH